MRPLLCLLLLLPALAAAQAAPTLPTGERARLEAVYQLTFRPDSTQPGTRTVP